MNYLMILVCFTVNIIICFGVPIGYFIYLMRKKPSEIKIFFIGVGVFLISQVFLRIPIIKYILPNFEWYNTMQYFYPIIYAIFLGITAGVFEEVGRFLGFKLDLNKKISLSYGISFGMGHAGIEAMIISGISSIRNLVMIISLNQGIYKSSRFGISEEKMIEVFKSLKASYVLMGGIERAFAIAMHIGLTLIVLYGISKKKKVYLYVAILIHGCIDSLFAILSTLRVSTYVIECLCGICSFILLVFSVKLFCDLKGEVFKNEKSL